jgi:uncharacterized RDD family membrane protein YckC
MAFCATCGKELSDSAVACPACGQPTGVQAAGGLMAAGAYAPYAGFWVRFVARLIDGLILLIPSAILGSRSQFGGLLIGFAYEWLMIAFNDGRTVGKMALGIRIARPDGSAVDLGTAAARAGMAIVSSIPFLLGYIWAAWDPEKRTWHDMVADTRAFRVPR